MMSAWDYDQLVHLYIDLVIKKKQLSKFLWIIWRVSANNWSRAKETKWSKFEKDERTYGTAVLTRLKRRRWAAAIFSGGAIVFWLGEKMGEVEGCQPPAHWVKPIQSAQLFGQARPQEDARSSPLACWNLKNTPLYPGWVYVDIGRRPVAISLLLKTSVPRSRLEPFSL